MCLPNRRSWFHKLLILLIACSLLTPPELVSCPTAYAGTPTGVVDPSQDDEPSEDGQDDESDCPATSEEGGDEEDSPPAEAPEEQGFGPRTSRDPVHLRRGSAIEREVDLVLPGPAFKWSHSRTYDSGSTESGHRVIFWQGTDFGLRLIPDAASGGMALIVSATNKRVFAGTSLTPPADYEATLVRTYSQDVKDYDNDSISNEDVEVYTLTETETGKVMIFLGNDGNEAESYRGRLVEQTSRDYQAISPTPPSGARFFYNADGRVASVTTAAPQSRQITYSYVTAGSIQQVDTIEVKNASSQTVQKAEYTYQDEVSSPIADLGSAGDLVQVKVSKLASDGTSWNERFTQYRYYQDTADGKYHQLKMVLEADAIERAIAAGAATSEANLLTKADSVVDDYASRLFTYYTADLETSASVTTPWGSQNLQTDYGGTNFLEYNTSRSFGSVKTETIGGCASCSGSNSGLKRSYFYLSSNGGSTDPNTVVRIVIEDTEDNANPRVDRYRRIWGLNQRSVALREALIENPTASPLKVWCESTILNSNFRATERRMPSAHAGVVTSNASLAQFLNPTGGASANLNDTLSVSTTTGVVYWYEYDNVNSGGDRDPTGVRVSKGRPTNGIDGSYYVSATDWGTGATNQPKRLPVASYVYPTQTQTRSTAKITSYSYEFWDTANKSLKKRTTTFPVIPTTENGAGGTTGATMAEYFDQLGRKRWTIDGEGYINYYSYHPDTGKLAYQVIDAHPGSLPSSADYSSNSAKWVTSTNYNASNAPTRASGLPGALSITTAYRYDDQGRLTNTNAAVTALDSTATLGDHHSIYYKPYETLRSRFLNSSGVPALPMQVDKFGKGGQLLERFTVKPSAVTGNPPSGYSAGQGNYTSWTRLFYHATTGQLVKVLRYHNIPTAGNGANLTNYYVTAFDYDALGRQNVMVQSVQDVAGYRDQITRVSYDVLDRITSLERDSGDSGVNTDPDATLVTGALSLSGLATIATQVFDAGGVGDNHVTSTRTYFGTGATDYIEKVYKRTFRGHLRGTDQYNGTTQFGPYALRDLDWQGRPTATAIVASPPSYWSTDYATAVVFNPAASSGLGEAIPGVYNATVMKYDARGRVYQRLRFPGTQSTDRIEVNRYFDRNGRLVATGDKHGAVMEFAFDGAGRRYQQRIVSSISTTPYTSGKFVYREPAPYPYWNESYPLNMVGGSDGMIEFVHQNFDEKGNVTDVYRAEVNHNDSDGLEADSDDYVRSTVFHWYDSANRRIASANYGSGDAYGSADVWDLNDMPSRDLNPPTASSAYALLTKYAYDVDTGRLLETTDPAGRKRRQYRDQLGRYTFVVENWGGTFDPRVSLTGIGGTANDENRTVGWKYNGLGKLDELTAYNAKASGTVETQATKYSYEHTTNLLLTTETRYPDYNASASPPDRVKVTYHLDGRRNTFTDQRGVELTYEYDNARRLTRQKVTNLPSGVDGTIQAISRAYDTLGRVERVTSAALPNGSSIQNEIKFTYNAYGLIGSDQQDHTDAVTGSEPGAQYGYNTSATSSVLTGGLAALTTAYPSGNFTLTNDFGTGFGVPLRRVAKLKHGTTTLAEYRYNGVRQLAQATRQYSTSNDTLDLYQPLSTSGTGAYSGLDRFGRVIEQSWRSGSTVTSRTSYAYDYAGNRTARNVQNVANSANDNFDQDYEYDGLHRLRDVDQGTAGTNHLISTQKGEQRFDLEGLGNWKNFKSDTDGAAGFELDQNRTHNTANELETLSTWVSPTARDAAGNMTSFPQPLAPTQVFGGVYDAWNRLVEVKNNAGAVFVKYEYDGLHRRIRKDFTDATPDQDFYYNLRWQLLETHQNGALSKRFVWGPNYVDELVLRDRDTSGGPGNGLEERLFVLQDALYNVVALTNASGVVQQRFHYDTYGKSALLNADFTLDTDGDGFEWEHRFTGRELDNETGLQLNRYRYYHSGLGRWVNRDPIGYNAGDANLYGYVGQRATLFVDPTGLEPPNDPNGGEKEPGQQYEEIIKKQQKCRRSPSRGPIDNIDKSKSRDKQELKDAADEALEELQKRDTGEGSATDCSGFLCDPSANNPFSYPTPYTDLPTINEVFPPSPVPPLIVVTPPPTPSPYIIPFSREDKVIPVIIGGAIVIGSGGSAAPVVAEECFRGAATCGS